MLDIPIQNVIFLAVIVALLVSIPLAHGRGRRLYELDRRREQRQLWAAWLEDLPCAPPGWDDMKGPQLGKTGPLPFEMPDCEWAVPEFEVPYGRFAT